MPCTSLFARGLAPCRVAWGRSVTTHSGSSSACRSPAARISACAVEAAPFTSSSLSLFSHKLPRSHHSHVTSRCATVNWTSHRLVFSCNAQLRVRPRYASDAYAAIPWLCSCRSGLSDWRMCVCAAHGTRVSKGRACFPCEDAQAVLVSSYACHRQLRVKRCCQATPRVSASGARCCR